METRKHTMVAVAESADELLFHCTECPRKLIFKKSGQEGPAVIERGDTSAVHIGGLGGIAARLGGSVGPIDIDIVP